MSTTPSPYGTGKSSGSISESAASSSCICDFDIIAYLTADDSADIVVTNNSTCELIITALTWFGSADPLSVAVVFPDTIPGLGMDTYYVAESYDIRGLHAIASTSCGDYEFTIPVI